MPQAATATDSLYHVYVIELAPQARYERKLIEANPDACRHRPVVYVGMTGRTPEIRFQQHKAGYKASRLVFRFGVGLRYDLMFEYRKGPLRTQEAAYAEEERIALALRADGYIVWSN